MQIYSQMFWKSWLSCDKVIFADNIQVVKIRNTEKNIYWKYYLSEKNCWQISTLTNIRYTTTLTLQWRVLRWFFLSKSEILDVQMGLRGKTAPFKNLRDITFCFEESRSQTENENENMIYIESQTNTYLFK